MSRTYDYLNGTNLYLYQDKAMFRMNSDTAMLAQFMNIRKGDRVLDIGTNNGALLIAANQYQPSALFGVEIQPAAVELAKENLIHHNITNAQLLEGDVKAMKLPKVHVVVCNPPYFKHHETSAKNESEALRIARHEVYLTLETLSQKVSEALDEKGRFYMVHRADRLIDITCTLRQYRLEVRKIQFIFDEHKEEAVGVLIEAMKDAKANCHVLPPLYRTR